MIGGNFLNSGVEQQKYFAKDDKNLNNRSASKDKASSYINLDEKSNTQQDEAQQEKEGWEELMIR